MGTIAEDLTGIKNIEDTLTSNKVATFAYTEQAYQNNDANGVTLYDVDKPQNIPVAQPNILKVNETILAKGWRSQASSIPRMLMNHFLGRCSYNLNKINDLMSSLLTTLLGHLGTANGIATLDASGKLPSGQIPTSVVQSVNSHSPTNGNVDISKSDVGLGSVVNTGDSATPAQGGTEKFTTGGAYTLKSDLEQSISSAQTSLEQSISGVSSSLTGHINNNNNPHNVTKDQVGLGNVRNTSDTSALVFGSEQKFTSGGAWQMNSDLKLSIYHKTEEKSRNMGIKFLSYTWTDDSGSRDITVMHSSIQGAPCGIVCLRLHNNSHQDSYVNFIAVDIDGMHISVKLYAVGEGWINNKLVRIGEDITLFGFIVPWNIIDDTTRYYEVSDIMSWFEEDANFYNSGINIDSELDRDRPQQGLQGSENDIGANG